MLYLNIMYKNILIVRVDKVRDGLLILPVVDIIKKSYPDVNLFF